MEEERLEIGETKGELQCKSISELGESNPSVGGESNGSMSLEDKPVDTECEKEVTLDNRGVAGESESLVEPVVGEEVAAAEEGGAGMVAAVCEEPPLQLEVEEESKPVEDVKWDAVVADTGDAPASSGELQVAVTGNEVLVGSQLELKTEEEISPVAGTNSEIIGTNASNEATFCDLQMDARGDEMVDSEKEPAPVVCTKVEADVTGEGNGQESSELKMEAVGDEWQAVEEQMEALDDKYELGVDMENNAETVLRGDEVDEREIGAVANESEVGTAEKPDGTKEEKPDLMITEDMPLPEDKLDSVIVTGVNVGAVNASEQEQVREEDNVDSKVRCEDTEDVKVAPGESLISGMKMENGVTPEVLDASLLHKTVNVPENLGDAVVKEEAPAGDNNTETSVGVGREVELTKDVVMEEYQLRDPEVETESGINDVADKIQQEDATLQTEGTTGNIDTDTKGGVVLESTGDAVTDEIQSRNPELESETETKEVVDETQEDGAMKTEGASGDILDDDGKMDHEETVSDVDESRHDIYDSPTGLQGEEDDAMVAEEETGTQDTEMETETDIADSGKTSGGKRKRGKLSKSASNSKNTAKAPSKKTVGEDVCFICFDGGELFLCDRRGCPKAYHPSCVNRDEAFFRSKGRWNCGWHMCSSCEKTARYMCYTCTFSLCKSCTKDSVILCVKGNKGFCQTCMRTVMLIENSEQGNNDIQIDFDDRSSWEFLFKDYYTELKAKLSLTSVEIAEAKNPWKGADMSGPSKRELSDAQADANDGGSGSDDSAENTEPIRPNRRKMRKRPKSHNKDELISTSVADGDKAITLYSGSTWASKELLEFVSHMKNGDTSVVSQFDVQELLLEYIKRNKLRDPRRKSQIICDARLENLFGKPRVAHFEMLKLLESHFLIRDEQNDDVQGSVVDTENNQLDIDGNADNLTKSVKDKKRKPRKKSGNRGLQSNLDDYAAIDMHNIGLIYLRRKLMEDLLEDAETFRDKVVGTFVRIRISGSTQKQDLYRLVQVVGTSKAAEPYRIGKKTTEFMVEILNLDKTEIISIDTISNQEFSEEECRRLRQSIKCGLISRLTVGEILDKTMELHAARVNDWLESETMRLSHLRDRASDLGRRKELRECVEKLQLLKTPGERQRRLEEIPDIHADPKMNPSYESDDHDSENEDSRRDAFFRPRGSGFSRRDRGPISPRTDNSVKDSWSGAAKVPSKTFEPSRNISRSNDTINASHSGEIVNEKSWNLEREKATRKSYNSEKLNSASTERPALRSIGRPESFSGLTQASSSTGSGETAVKINESEKMWHYKDPSGKVQGPFSVVQLRKWNNTGYFPTDLKIWRTTETQDNSVLLADALDGKFPKVGPPPAVADMLSAINTLHSSHILDQERTGSVSNVSTDNSLRSDITTNLPSPTPKQNIAGLSEGANGVLTSLSSTAAVPNIVTHSSTPASVLASVLQTALSPTPNPQLGSLVGSAVSLHTQATMTIEPRPGNMPAPVQNVSGQNLQAGDSSLSGQPQGYGWSAPVAPVGLQPNMPPPATPNMPWGSMQANNPNMGWGNPTNMNWGHGNPTGWVAPPGNTGANMVPGNANSTPGWVPPAQVPLPGNGWCPPVVQGNMNQVPQQGWVAPPPTANQGSWHGDQNNSGSGPFPGQRGGGQGQDGGFGGGRPPWNRQSSFRSGGGGSRPFSKGETLCPYNANGRCIKGSRCDYLHT